MIPYSKQSISKEDVSSVIKVMRSNLLTQGKHLNILSADGHIFCGFRTISAVNTLPAQSAIQGNRAIGRKR